MSDQEHGRTEPANRGGAAAREQRSSLRSSLRSSSCGQGERGRRLAGYSRPFWQLKYWALLFQEIF